MKAVIIGIISIVFGIFMLLTPKKTYERAEEIYQELYREYNIKFRRFSSIKSNVILCRISGVLTVIIGVLLLIVKLK